MNKRLHIRSFFVTVCTLVATLFVCPRSNAELWLPHSLSDHILFQQDEPILLWGKAAPHSEITAEIADENSGAAIDKANALADADGHWRISLKSLKASFRKYSIRISGDGVPRLISDVLVGELWLSGGQSNMELRLRYILGGKELTASTAFNGIRIFYQDTLDESWKKGVPQSPVDDTVNGRWLPATSGTNVADCSGVAYTFALALYEALNRDGREVPVGVMNSAVGATGVESWMSRGAAEGDPLLKTKLPAHWNVGKWAGYNQPWNQATALFNLKIAPLTQHAVRGFIWYQGENNAGFGESGAEFYKKALTALIADWRHQWGGQPRPFIASQLAAFDDDGKMPLSDLESWAYLRESQIEVAQSAPKTVAIPIYDIQLTWNTGDFDYKAPIHPLDKEPIGQRMAMSALSIAYNQPIEYQGPTFDRMEINGRKAELYFQHAPGLKAGGGGRLFGFAICGADRRFVEANARIVGNKVEVANSHVKHPVAVTYAFTAMNHCANLLNRDNLPAYPFRTDEVASAFLKGCTATEAKARLSAAPTESRVIR
jgi:sialate O-acetylesterase